MWPSRERVSMCGPIQLTFKTILGPLLVTSGGSATHPITTALPLTADIIGGFRVERRIEIDQVNALGRDAVAENL